MLTEVYGADAWRYRPEARDAAGTAHLAGFDRAHVPAFVWPTEEVTSAAPQ